MHSFSGLGQGHLRRGAIFNCPQEAKKHRREAGSAGRETALKDSGAARGPQWRWPISQDKGGVWWGRRCLRVADEAKLPLQNLHSEVFAAVKVQRKNFERNMTVLQVPGSERPFYDKEKANRALPALSRILQREKTLQLSSVCLVLNYSVLSKQ